MSKTVVGKLNKAFGVKGYIKVVPLKPYIADLNKCDTWFIERGNDHIPYFVESIEEDPHFLVKFEEIDAPEDAKVITGCSILLRDKDITIEKVDHSSDLDKLVNFKIEENGNSLGKIIRIEEFPQQTMSFIDNGVFEFMMPLTPDFIEDIDLENRVISVNLPEGFVDSQS